MKKFLKITAITLASLIALFVLLIAAIIIADEFLTFTPPPVDVPEDGVMLEKHSGFAECHGGKIRLNEAGTYELLLEGSADERGIAYSTLAPQLIRYQEDIFISQIRSVIPSERYIRFLRKLIVFFARNLNDKYFPEEYRREIFGISLAADSSEAYEFIGTPYERQINYHAAHDFGHVMQSYLLVGCSSFAAWDEFSADSALIVGRNFDFYFGDDFARHKIILFVRPEHGIPFVSISWPAMIGVVSGMNTEGLTVTINAAKGKMPLETRTPISILVREILQYASTIDEAYQIANQYDTFVAESILVASAKEHRAAIIEKSPSAIALYETENHAIACSNHYQSELFENEEDNIENIALSDSKYRLDRMRELIDSLRPIDENRAAEILRNRFGLGGKDIGIGNEKSINQYIAHHSVIFKPDSLQLWVSTAPWQSGAMNCYDLREVFNADFSDEIARHELDILPDSQAIKNDVARKVRYDAIAASVKQATKDKVSISNFMLDELTRLNPELYKTYTLLGDYFTAQYSISQAIDEYNIALTKEIPYVSIREEIEKKIRKLSN